MRRSRWTCSELAAAAAAIVLSAQGTANAQACCVAPSAWGLGRLASYEKALIGAQATAQAGYGSFDSSGTWRPMPRGAQDLELQQTFFGTMRVLGRGELTASVPWMETWRSAGPIRAVGEGLGDAGAGLRWSLLRDEEAGPGPGVALLAGVVLPTGRPPEQAGDPLAAGATGTGALQGYGGLQLEKTWGPWLVTGYGTITGRGRREVGGVTSQLAPRFAAGAAGGYAWRSGAALSLGAAYAAEGDAQVAGNAMPGSGNRSLTLFGAVEVPVMEHARLVLAASACPPVPSASVSTPAFIGASASVVRGWD